MSSNGNARPHRPRIEVVAGGPSDAQAAAIAAALEQFLIETAPAPAPGRRQAGGWQRAALHEGVHARDSMTDPSRDGMPWGH